MSSDRTWEKIQQKTFTGWVNSHLRKRNLVVADISKDLEDGLKLVNLLEIISDEEISKKLIAKNPTMRIQKVQNVGAALKFIGEHGVKLAGIGAEEVVDGNLKMILGMIWTIILRFSIQDISLEDLSAKEGLLLWCQKKTHGYAGVNVKNFHMSFQDGLAFCALIHKHRPDLIDWDSLDKSNKALCLQTAFDVAEKHLDIPKLLDPADMLDVAKPDERSVMTYVSLYYHVFASSQKAEVAGRRVAKVLDFAESVDKLKNDYNSRAQGLVDWLNNTTNQLNDRSFDNTLEGVVDQLNDFKTFKSNDKPPKFNEKVELEALINALQTKLQLNNRPAFVPPHGLASQDLNNLWAKLEQAESDRGVALREELRRMKRISDLLRRFLKLAGSLENWSSDRSAYLSNTDYGDSVSATTAKLKNLEAFDGEFVAQNKRVATLHDYERQLAELQYHDIATIHSRASGVDGALSNLRSVAEHRKDALTEHLRKLEEREKQLLDFAKRALEFRVWLEGADEVLSDPIVCETVEYAKELQANFEQIVSEKADREGEYNGLNELAANLQAQGVPENTYSDVSIATLNSLWNNISGQFDSRRADLESEVSKQQEFENLRVAFADKAKAVHAFSKETLAKIEALSGDLEEQVNAVHRIQGEVASHQSLFDEAINANHDLESNKITDNPHTEITVETLKSFWDALLATLKKKEQVLEKERLAKSNSGLSPEQLNEFRECFFHFDKDEDKLLSRLELGACLKSLGEELTFEEGGKLDTIMTSIDGDSDGKCTFDEFVGYMERSSTGSDTADSIKQAFRTIAGDKDYVTKNELQSVLPADKVEYILARIKPYPGVDNAYDYNTFTDSLYGH